MKELDSFEFEYCCDYFASTQGVILGNTKVPLDWIAQTLRCLKKTHDLWEDYSQAAGELSMRCKCIIIAAVIQQTKETYDSKEWLAQKGNSFLSSLKDEMPEELICAAEYLLVHGRMPSRKYIANRSPYRLKVVLSDVHYVYSGYPHDDEQFEVSVWKGDTMIPIGDIARVIHGSDGSVIDAISRKYGCDFAKKFEDAISVFNEEWWEEIDDDMEVYGRISACCRDDTEDKLRQLEELGIEVEDARSEKSKQIGRGISKLRSSIGNSSFIEELVVKGRLTNDEMVKVLSESYGVCEDAAKWYVNNRF